MKVFKDIIQRSPEWLQIRKGRPTASNFSEIITAQKGDLSKSCNSYINLLIGECFVPEFEYWSGNAYTERGKEYESEARAAFEAETGNKLEEVGFCISDDGICGCSPDALILAPKSMGVEYLSGLELKCPTPKVHVGYVLDGVLPDAYKQQVHGSMAVTGLGEWHFWSYFPGMRHLHVVVKRDDYTKRLEASLAAFVAEYKPAREKAIEKLRIDIDHRK